MKFGDYTTKSEFKAVPEGTHIGVVTGFAFLGLQPGSQMYPAPAYKVALTISFPGQLTDKGEELTVTQQYSLTMSKKGTFRKVIEAIRGDFKSDAEVKDFDFRSLLGAGALWSIVHKHRDDKVFANVKGVIAIPAGMPTPVSKTPQRYFTPDLESGQFVAAYNELPEFLRKKWDERLPDENRESEDVAV